MSVAVGTEVRFIDRKDPGYMGLADGSRGRVIADDKYVNMFDAKDEFVVQIEKRGGQWYFSEGDEGVTWERVSA